MYGGGRTGVVGLPSDRSGMGRYTPSSWSSGGKIDTSFGARGATRARWVGGGWGARGRRGAGGKGGRFSSRFRAELSIESSQLRGFCTLYCI